jgi:hypothetical protein
VQAASGDEQLEECRREAATQRECSYAACQKRAQSHRPIECIPLTGVGIGSRGGPNASLPSVPLRGDEELLEEFF